MDFDIEELPVPTRIHGRLKKGGITKWSHLLAKTEMEILRIPYMNAVDLHYIKEALAQFDMKLKD